MTRGRPRPPEVFNCPHCVPGQRCDKHRSPRVAMNGKPPKRTFCRACGAIDHHLPTCPHFHEYRAPSICLSCGKTPCRPSCPKFDAPPSPPSVRPPQTIDQDGRRLEGRTAERLPGGRPKNPELDVPAPVTLTPAATFYEGPSGAAYRNKPPFTPSVGDFHKRLQRLQAIERAATELTRLWEEAPLGTTSAAQLRAAEAELRRVVRSS